MKEKDRANWPNFGKDNTYLLSDEGGVRCDALWRLPTEKGVRSEGRIFIQVVDENDGESPRNHLLAIEEVYTTKEGDMVFVGFHNKLAALATEALHAAYKYISKNVGSGDGPLAVNVDPEWERETITRLMHYITDEIEMGSNIPQEKAEMYLYQ